MLVVLFGALLHASWNVLAKSGGDALIDTSLILLGGSVLAVLALPLLPAPAPASWPFIAASSGLQAGYFALVGAAYRSGDVSLAYPLMRGAAPLLLALVSSAVLGETLSVGAACGVVIICIGVLTMALAHRRSHGDWHTASRW
jgi:multidrug transporter EmrE-like cation transporter